MNEYDEMERMILDELMADYRSPKCPKPLPEDEDDDEEEEEELTLEEQIEKEKTKAKKKRLRYKEWALTTLQEKYAHITLGGSPFVIEDDDIMTTKPYQTVRAELSHMRYQSDKGDRQCFDDWCESKDTIKYSGTVFDAGYVAKPDSLGLRKYNQWRGWAVEPNPDGDCSLFYDLLFRIICNKRQNEYDYFLNWLAHIIQFPTAKLQHQTAIALRGVKGIGKGTCCMALQMLFNPANFLQTAQRNDLFSKFNGALLGKVLVFGDEIDWPGDKEADGLFKDLITSANLRIEEKFMKAYVTKNCCRFILATNCDWAVPVGEGERRYVVFEPSPEEKGNITYFKSIIEQMKGGGAGKLLHDMLNRDISKVDWTDQPRNDAFIAQRERGMSIVERFVLASVNSIEEEVTPWNEANSEPVCPHSIMRYLNRAKEGHISLKRDEAYKCFLAYSKNYAYPAERNYPISSDKFHEQFRKILFGGKNWHDAKKMIDGIDYYNLTPEQMEARWNEYVKR